MIFHVMTDVLYLKNEVNGKRQENVFVYLWSHFEVTLRVFALQRSHGHASVLHGVGVNNLKLVY